MSDIIELFDTKAAALLFGEPTWGYFKQYVSRHRRSRNSREFYHSSGDWVPVEKEEYEREHEAAEKMDTDRFMGRVHVGNFWRYSIRRGNGGWIEVLEKRLKELTIPS